MPSGFVGINTREPQTILDVNGEIDCNEIKVNSISINRLQISVMEIILLLVIGDEVIGLG